jgi:hypothetical protein
VPSIARSTMPDHVGTDYKMYTMQETEFLLLIFILRTGHFDLKSDMKIGNYLVVYVARVLHIHSWIS